MNGTTRFAVLATLAAGAIAMAGCSNNIPASTVSATHSASNSGNDSAIKAGDCISDPKGTGWVRTPCNRAEDLVLAVLPEGNANGTQCYRQHYEGHSVKEWWSPGLYNQISNSNDNQQTYCMITGP